jgi:hypothetical protein
MPVICTFGANLEFYEGPLWRHISRARNRVVLADDVVLAGQLADLASGGSRLRHINRRYLATPITNERSAQRVAELAVVGHDVREVVRAACLQVDVVDRVGHGARDSDVVAGQFEVTGRRFDPRGQQQRVGPVAWRGGVADRVECGQADGAGPVSGADASLGNSSTRRSALPPGRAEPVARRRRSAWPLPMQARRLRSNVDPAQ